ncbi:hypothetical protein Tco_0394217 [Tanacetum coccineum]
MLFSRRLSLANAGISNHLQNTVARNNVLHFSFPGSSNFFLTSLRKPKEDLIVILASDTSISKGGNGGVGVGNGVSGGGGNGGSDGGGNGGGV